MGNRVSLHAYADDSELRNTTFGNHTIVMTNKAYIPWHRNVEFTKREQARGEIQQNAFQAPDHPVLSVMQKCVSVRSGKIGRLSDEGQSLMRTSISNSIYRREFITVSRSWRNDHRSTRMSGNPIYSSGRCSARFAVVPG